MRSSAIADAVLDPSPIASTISGVFSPQVLYWSADIERWAAEFQLDPNLVATVMQIESCGHPSVGSSAGAMGLFQVMPYHFEHDEIPTDPETNARRGLQYLARSLQIANGDVALALAGYNGGHGVIGRDPSHWPAETVRYVRWGAGLLADVRSGAPASGTLAEWMQAGGHSLCSRAAEALAVRFP